jgi:CRISPR-associated endonuclease/helicase Cas3
MAQRFGRVNRFGERDDSTITVVHESEFATAKPLEVARAQTLVLLRKLDGDASPAALDALNRRLSTAEREVAFSPLPEMRTASAIQFDAWALTTIRESIAARPPVAPYLHGEAEWQPPETHVAWRDDRDFKHITEAEAFLEAFPLRPQELLRDTSNRIATNLEKLLKPGADLLEAWVVSEGGVVSRLSLINFNKTVAETLLADAILILPTSVGGLANGLFSPTADGPANDVSGIRRIETDSCDEILENCKLIRSVEISREDADEQRFLLWFETKEAAQAYGVAAKQAHNSQNPDTLATHTRAVEGHARALAAKLLPAPSSGEPDLRRCLIIAATLHDSGKNRAQWQRNLGNRAHLGIPDYDPTQPKSILAKSVPGMRPRNLAEHYRHEFGSLNDTSAVSGFSDLSEIERDIALHLAAAHHGRARPHFPKDEIFDPHPSASPETSIALATEIQSRFARLQRRFGRWGLAWLESLLRAADYAASSGISPQNNPASESEPNVSSDKAPLRPEIRVIDSLATINLRLNPSNPGHYFACCGVFELATALVPDTQAWFENNSSSFNIAAAGLSLDGLLRKVIASDIVALKSEDRPLTPLVINFAGNDSGRCALHLDWWRHEGGSLGKLKPWAGQMSVRDIADDMRETLKRELVLHKTESLKDILFLSSTQNVGEPFYFDANRAINAKAQDVGFSVDKLKKGSQKVTSMATPAVELLCLIGLQRARPLLALNERGKEREYEYHLWYSPLSLPLLAAAASGLLAEPTERYRFANPSRAKDYRAFAPAKLVS